MKLSRAAIGVSDEDEARIGREVGAHLAGKYTLVEDEKRTKYLNLVGTHLAKQSSRPNITYYFAILKTAEVNAWAAPGGYVFVTEGLLAFLKNEAELASVLAHEISHISQRHIVQAIRKANLIEAGEDLAAAADAGMDRFTRLSNYSIDLLTHGLSRSDELEADRLGVILAAGAGYDPEAYRAMLERLADAKPDNAALARLHKTHPPAAQRLKTVQSALAKNKIGSGGALLPERYTQIRKP